MPKSKLNPNDKNPVPAKKSFQRNCALENILNAQNELNTTSAPVPDSQQNTTAEKHVDTTKTEIPLNTGSTRKTHLKKKSQTENGANNMTEPQIVKIPELTDAESQDIDFDVADCTGDEDLNEIENQDINDVHEANYAEAINDAQDIGDINLENTDNEVYADVINDVQVEKAVNVKSSHCNVESTNNFDSNHNKKIEQNVEKHNIVNSNNVTNDNPMNKQEPFKSEKLKKIIAILKRVFVEKRYRYDCWYCLLRFNSKRLALKHMVKKHHKRIFHCKHCDDFGDKMYLIKHMTWHKTNKAYQQFSRPIAMLSMTGLDVLVDSDVEEEDIIDDREIDVDDIFESDDEVDVIESKYKRLNKKKVPASDPLKSNTKNEIKKETANDSVKSNNKKEMKKEATLNTCKKMNPTKLETKAMQTPKVEIKENSASNMKKEFMNCFSDDSDTDNGFGPLPESVLRAIEDSQDGQDDISENGLGNPNHQKIMSNNSKIRTCPTCQKTYSASSSYFYHLKYAHSTDRDHICDNCGEGFRTKANLVQHMPIHTGEKNFKCTHCPKSFRTQASRYIHVKELHTQNKEYVCEHCDKSFKWAQKLLRHMKRHDAEKAHVCSTCGKGFNVNCDLVRHVKTHSQEKPFSCSICNMSFSQTRYLKVHMERMHGRRTRSQGSENDE